MLFVFDADLKGVIVVAYQFILERQVSDMLFRGKLIVSNPASAHRKSGYTVRTYSSSKGGGLPEGRARKLYLNVLRQSGNNKIRRMKISWTGK